MDIQSSFNPSAVGPLNLSLIDLTAFLMASPKGNGQFLHDREVSGREETQTHQTGDQTHCKPGAATGIYTPRLIHVQQRFTWFPASRAGASGASGLVFHPPTNDFLLSVQNCSPKIHPPSTAGTAAPPEPFISISPLKQNQKGIGNILCAVPVFLQICLRSSHHFFVSQTLVTKAVPSLKSEKTSPEVRRAWGDLHKVFLLL